MKTFRLIFAMQLIFASLAFSASNSASQSGSNRTFTVSGVSFTMVYVQGGTFTMGCTDEQGGNGEKPAHQVTLSSYYVGKFEVTQALWQAVMGSNPSNFKGDNLPVEQVSWEDCKGFISQLNVKTGQNFRLPTEAEWEYAARGGSRGTVTKYAGSNTISDAAWYVENSGDSTHPVGTKRANELGVYDMSGNVWEWCNDWDGAYSSSSQTNPTGAAQGSNHVFRGGSWYSFSQNCRVSFRYNYTHVLSSYYLGFRLALSK